MDPMTLSLIQGIAQSLGSVGTGIKNRTQLNYAAQSDPYMAEAVLDTNPFTMGDTMRQAKDSIRNRIVDYSEVKNNDTLINTWNDNDLQNDFGNLNGWQLAGNFVGNTLENTLSLDPINGAINQVGNLYNVFTAKSREEELNNAKKAANEQQINNFYITAKNNQTRQQRQAMMNYFALGGNLDGLNGIEHFNVGGSHGENPNGGVQQGVAPDGQPNMVEEGEVKYKDYIYSKRIKPSKALLKKNNLPEKYAGLSYAEIADKLQQESEDRPNDPISTSTLDDWMLRLQSAQEETKTSNAVRRATKIINGLSDEEKLGILAMMQGGEQPIMANGGKIHIAKNKRGTFTAAAKKRGMGVQEFANKVVAHPENYSEAMRKKAQFAKNFGGHKHAEGGGLIGQIYDVSEEEYNKLTSPTNNSNSRNAAHWHVIGGPNLIWPRTEVNGFGEPTMPVYSLGVNTEFDIDPRYNPTSMQLDSGLDFDTLYNYNKALNNDNSKVNSLRISKPKSKFSFNEDSLRYAPAIGAGIGALTSLLQGRDYTYANQLRDIAGQYNPMSAPKIGGYRAYTPFDVNLGDTENLALQASALRGNRGQNRATQSALDNAVLNRFQEIAAKRNLAAQQANEAKRAEVDKYNFDIDRANASLQQAYDQLNANIKDKRLGLMASAAGAQDASDTAWSNSLSTTSQNFFNQLGRVGEDNWAYNQFLII